MQLPERHDERVAMLPFEVAFADPGAALPSHNVINRRARMAVSAGEFLALEELNLARYGRISIAPGYRIDVAQQSTIIGIALMIAHSAKRGVGFFPRITKRHTALMIR